MPTFSLSCSGKSYSLVEGQVDPVGGAFTLNTTSRQLLISDWSQLAADTFYNLTLTVTLRENTTNTVVALSDNFILVVGASYENFYQVPRSL